MTTPNAIITRPSLEEIERLNRLEKQEPPTLDERMTAVESSLTDLEYIITGEVKTDAK